MARPTKLTPELLDKARGYLATCIDTPVFNDKDTLTYVNVNLPSKVGLALYLGIDKTTVDEWASVPIDDITVDNIDIERVNLIERQTEFSSIVKEIMAEQEKRLVNNGLGGLYKEKTTGMLLSKHGYVTEKTETDITSKGEQIQGSILPEVIAEADRLLKEKKLNE